jgi:hypothetical protein
MSMRRQLLAASLLLVACEAAPLMPDLEPQFSLDNKAANSAGLFRVVDSQFPFYARAEPPSETGGFAYRTDEWAAVVFYRQPACVPQSFNLFEFYDIPGAFACTPTTEGHALHIEPLGMTPPKESHLSGNAVPIWFVPWHGAFEQAVDAGVLTVAQLSAMPGLRKGVATHYQENLATVANRRRARPEGPPACSGGGCCPPGRWRRPRVSWPRRGTAQASRGVSYDDCGPRMGKQVD